MTWLQTSPPLNAIARLIAVPLPSLPGVIAFGLGVIAFRLGVVTFSLAIIALPIAFNGGLVYNHTVTNVSTTYFIVLDMLSIALAHFIIAFDTHFFAIQLKMYRMVAQIIVFIHYIAIQK